MERDIFQRGNRMTFRFGKLEEQSSVVGTFDLPTPKFGQRSSPSVTVQQYGEAGYSGIREGQSGIAKPNGQLARFTTPPEIVGDTIGSGAGSNTTAKRGK